MKTVLLNGGGQTAPYGEIADRAKTRLERRGAVIDAFDLTTMDIKPCRGCFACWVKTPGLCFQRDAMDVILPRLARSEAVVWITPLAYGGYGYHLKKALDRSIPILLPFFTKIGDEVHHPTRYGWEPRLAVIGVQPEPDPEAEWVFRELVDRNAINMHAHVKPFILRGSEADGRWEDGLESLLSDSAPAAGIEVRP
jgi:hypothetical protein